MSRIVCIQNVVIEEVGSRNQTNNSYSTIEDQTQDDPVFHQALGHGRPHRIQPEDHSVENNPGRKDYPSLETTARSKITVKLDIKGKEKNEGDTFCMSYPFSNIMKILNP